MAAASLMIKSNVSKDLIKFGKDSTKFISMAKVRTTGDTPFQLLLSGEMCTAGRLIPLTLGINAMEFGVGKQKKTTYSVGITMEEDSPQIHPLLQIAALAKIEADKISPEMEFNEFLKDDKLFIKLRTDAQNRSFACKSNLKIDPKKYSDTNTYDNVTFTGEAQVWFNLEDLKYGISLIPKKIEFSKEGE
jgi:hypothetical protein